MSAQENVIALVVQRDDLAALELGLGREEGAEEGGGQEAEGRAEVVEDEFGVVGGWVSVAGQSGASGPVGDGEVEGRSGG